LPLYKARRFAYYAAVYSPQRLEKPKMPRRPGPGFNESDLSKSQLRKLNALRKSIGEDIGTKAFAEWLKTSGGVQVGGADKNAEIIAEAVMPLVKERGLTIPRGGYIVRRGRVIVERPSGAED
jgi:hypothetical protein